MKFLPLPDQAQRLCDELHAPERLQRHLRLVHDVTASLLNRLAGAFPSVTVERHSVLLGAAVHDLGKTLHPEELTGVGRRHELDGPILLRRHGLPEPIARFARTHGTWESEFVTFQELLVALADHLWRGSRDNCLENRVLSEITRRTAQARWAGFVKMDDICMQLAADGEARMRWQALGASSDVPVLA